MEIEVYVCECGNAATTASIEFGSPPCNWRFVGVYCARCNAEMRCEVFDLADSKTRQPPPPPLPPLALEE